MKAYLRNLMMAALVFASVSGQVGEAGSRTGDASGKSATAFVGPVLPAPEPEQPEPEAQSAGQGTAMAAAEQAPTQAEAPAVGKNPTVPAEEGWGAGAQLSMFRTIGGMGVVIFLMAAIYFAAKKFAPRYFAKPVSERNLKIIETLSMGDKRAISLIQVAGSRYLVGNTPHQISLLVSLPAMAAPQAADTAMAPPESARIAGNSAGNIAAKIAERKDNRTASFRSIFEVEKKRPSPVASSPLPDDLRSKMQQLREALERS